MTTALANALFEASRSHPELRVGELMYRALLLHYDFGAVFWVEDAELTAALREYAKEGER